MFDFFAFACIVPFWGTTLGPWIALIMFNTALSDDGDGITLNR